jgi:hypothetical protein
MDVPQSNVDVNKSVCHCWSRLSEWVSE